MKSPIFFVSFLRMLQPTLLFVGFILFNSSLANANNWQTDIYKSGLGQKIVAIDKSSQLFHYFGDEKATKLNYTFNCTTGQVDGDKQIMNDLKTPEGVYFVQYKISDGLDFIEYGGTAYTLNYPNPVDKLRGKTGYGIWIHSKGLGIKPRDTRGCIAIGLDELAKVGPKLSYGTAVLLAETIKIKHLAKPDLQTATTLINKMDKWTKAWAARSHTMFKMYNQKAYSKSMPESFNAFKANKVNLFSFLPWINIINRQVYALEGPGYWVTWSEQFYRAPNLSTEGIRRLYWQLNKDNEYKIVGMEWMPRNLGMKADFLNGTLVASTQLPKPVVQSSETPILPELSMPEEGKLAVAELNEAKDDKASTPKIEQVVLNEQIQTILQNKMLTWLNAWQNKSNDFFSFYDQINFGKISILNTKTAENIQVTKFDLLKKDMQQNFNSKWITIVSRPITANIDNNRLYSQGELFIRSHKQVSMQGILRLYWDKNDKGEYLIIDSSWQDKKIDMSVDYIKAAKPTINSFLAQWQKVWLGADVDSYAGFYERNATQQNLIGRERIAKHKRTIWKKSKPKEIIFSDISIKLDPEGLIVKMTQAYKDSNGYADVGTKTLLLQPNSDSYIILKENWKRSK